MMGWSVSGIIIWNRALVCSRQFAVFSEKALSILIKLFIQTWGNENPQPGFHYPIALFKAIIAVLKSSLATKNWIFTWRRAKPALLILIPFSAKAVADLASRPG